VGVSPLRAAVGAVLAGGVLLCAGCGGTSATAPKASGSVPASASLVPWTAPLYVYGNTDLKGTQWAKVQKLAAKFPARDRLLAQLETSLAKEHLSVHDLEAVGPELGLSTFSFEHSREFFLAKPPDPASFRSLVRKMGADSPGRTHVASVAGWTVAAASTDDVAASRSASAGRSLADRPAFTKAMGALPDDALVKVYVDGKAVAESLVDAVRRRGLLVSETATPHPTVIASARATDTGVELQATVDGDKPSQTQPKAYKAELPALVPADVIAFTSFKTDLGDTLGQVRPALAPLTQTLGTSPEPLLSLFSGGEGAFYIRNGSPIPELTLVITEEHPKEALSRLDAFVRQVTGRFGASVDPTTIDGVPAARVTVGGRFQVYYGQFDGKLVISDSIAGITGLKDPGDKLADDKAFTAATSAAGMPDETTGFVYVNGPATMSLVDSFASIAGHPVPTEVDANLRPLRSLVAFGTASPGELGFKAFLEIR